ncbi:monooxygenase [Serratia fonticola]|uniref:monooxygenase n=1 Tax=Serratia fonticola TaxID=47917 RepID=UPI0003F50D8E|nr:monooxygenase [Serratia fonticola]AKG72086.1 monooxygenase [Serratia fonticola]CAI1725075.1 Putative monooxygenase ydhR [Serratia fonticola]CAI1777630.1 Putative monooxygenase ydhR [Serratia fonticola]
MSVILQIDFSFPADQLGATLSKNAQSLAESINQEPGFISKIWTENEHTGEAGGIYFFENRVFAEKYAEHHVKRAEAMGAKNIHLKIFDINLPLTKINHGRCD